MKTATDEIGKGDEMAGQGKTEKTMVEKVDTSDPSCSHKCTATVVAIT